MVTAEIELPSVFGRYLLLRRLSRGGMGEIFIARSGQLSGFEKLMVIKKVLSHLAADREFIRRFIDEASVAIKLAHANICQVFEVGMVEEEYFLAMEWVDGRDLRRTLSRLADRKARLPVDLALLIMRDVASGLAYAHRRTDDQGKPLNLVHCDISPPNVIVAFEGEVKIIDFGIAKSALRATKTNPKMGFGKYGYMAPEQLVQGGVIDRRTDIYAAGVLLYELLTGKRMFVFPEGADYRHMARMVAGGDHMRPSDADSSLVELDDLLLKAVSPDPAKRFHSAEELRDALQVALAHRSPTLTNDRLGAYMRELFAEEMAEEREALRLARAVDLSAFAWELEGGKTETVTFAAADEEVSGIRTGFRRPPPLPAPPESGESPAVDADSDEEPTVVDLGARPAPPLAPPPPEVDEDDAHPVLVESVEEPARRSRLPLMVVAGAAAALVAFGLWRLREEPAPERPSAPASAAPPAGVQPFVVQPIPMPVPSLVARPAAADAGAASAPAARAETPRAEPPARAERSRSVAAAAKPVKPPSEPPAAPTAASVQAKYQSVARDYAEFRKQYGERLETDWNDILDFATYAAGEDKQQKLDSKLSQFRRRMAQIRAGN